MAGYGFGQGLMIGYGVWQCGFRFDGGQLMGIVVWKGFGYGDCRFRVRV